MRGLDLILPREMSILAGKDGSKRRSASGVQRSGMDIPGGILSPKTGS